MIVGTHHLTAMPLVPVVLTPFQQYAPNRQRIRHR